MYNKPIKGYVEPNDCDRSIFWLFRSSCGLRSEFIGTNGPDGPDGQVRTTFWSFWISDPKIFLHTLKSVLIKWGLKSQVYLRPGSETTFESLETISGPISWFECSIRVSGTQWARFHSYFQNLSRKIMDSSLFCRSRQYSLDHMIV